MENNRLDSLFALFPVVEEPVKTYFFAQEASDPALNSTVTQWFKDYQTTSQVSLDTDAREYIYGIAAKPLEEDAEAAERQDRTFLTVCCQLVDTFLLLSITQQGVEAAAAHTLLEDILSIKAIGWCQLFWPYLESRESLLCRGLSGVRAPGTTLIRLCNALLKRTSRNRNARFAGRILSYLTRAFPLAEKSGLNKNGEFNTDNITVWEDNAEAMDDDDIFYNRFWSLQPLFADPVRLFTQPKLLSELKSNITLVMDELKSRQLESHKAGLMKRKRKDRGGNTIPTIAAPTTNPEPLEAFIPKYLTRRNLFDLQLKDIKFRRSVLAQIFIFARFMISLGSSERAKWASIGAVNKSVMFNFVLEDADVEFFQTIINNLTTVSHASSDLSGGFVRTLSTVVLVSDINWTNWKLKACSGAPFDAAMITKEDLQRALVGLESIKKPRKPYWYALGTSSLSQLWKVELGLDSLSDPSRWAVESARSWWDQCKDLHKEKEISPEDGDVDRLLASKTWQGLRAARLQGHWTDFGKVTGGRGFGGLFDDLEFSIKPEEVVKEIKKVEVKPVTVDTVDVESVDVESVDVESVDVESVDVESDVVESDVIVTEESSVIEAVEVPTEDIGDVEEEVKSDSDSSDGSDSPDSSNSDNDDNSDNSDNSDQSGTSTPTNELQDTDRVDAMDVDSEPSANSSPEPVTEPTDSPSAQDDSEPPAKKVKTDN